MNYFFEKRNENVFDELDHFFTFLFEIKKRKAVDYFDARQIHSFLTVYRGLCNNIKDDVLE